MNAIYILVNPNNITENEDDILDQIEMTEAKATELNNERRKNGNDCRWIKKRPKNGFQPFKAKGAFR